MNQMQSYFKFTDAQLETFTRLMNTPINETPGLEDYIKEQSDKYGVSRDVIVEWIAQWAKKITPAQEQSS